MDCWAEERLASQDQDERQTCASASAGCNGEVRVTPLHAGPRSATTDLPMNHRDSLQADWRRILADHRTLVVDCADQTAQSNEESMSTRSSATKVKAKVTDIEYNEYG